MPIFYRFIQFFLLIFTVAPTGDHVISLVDEISFTFPPAPPLSQIDDIPPEQFCNGDNRPADCGANCMCTHKVDIPHNAIVEVVLVDEGNYRFFIDLHKNHAIIYMHNFYQNLVRVVFKVLANFSRNLIPIFLKTFQQFSSKSPIDLFKISCWFYEKLRTDFSENRLPICPQNPLPIFTQNLLPIFPQNLLPAFPRNLLPICPQNLLPILPQNLLPIFTQNLLPICPQNLLPILPQNLLPIFTQNLLPIFLKVSYQFFVQFSTDFLQILSLIICIIFYRFV